MKVALLGAPGSGKTKIARRVVNRLNKNEKEWKAIDGYVQRLAERTKNTYGFLTDYRQHLQVIATRWIIEDDAIQPNTITCGSIYESMIYATGPSIQIPSIGQEDLMLQETRVANLMMQMLGVFETRYFDYDILFRLSLPENNGVTWQEVIDAKLPDLLDGYGKYAVELTGTDRQKVDRATEIIQAVASNAGA